MSVRRARLQQQAHRHEVAMHIRQTRDRLQSVSMRLCGACEGLGRGWCEYCPTAKAVDTALRVAVNEIRKIEGGKTA